MRANKKKQNNLIKVASYIVSIVIWIIIWHIAAKVIDNTIFLPEPTKVLEVLVNDLLPAEEFRASLLASILHIGKGFLIGAVAGILCAILSSLCEVIKTFLWFPIKVIKSVPVASFVILSLLWFDAEQLAVVISAMVVLPTMYINTLTGIQQTNEKLIDMAKVFRVSLKNRIVSIYVPSVIPFVLSASSLAVGMAWKAGIAAEIIGLAKNSIGNELYKAKLYFMIPELFAWTIVIVVLSILCEFIIKLLIKCIER